MGHLGGGKVWHQPARRGQARPGFRGRLVAELRQRRVVPPGRPQLRAGQTGRRRQRLQRLGPLLRLRPT
eukprot:5243543-Alexandrium_andersonii.AAC.1